MFQSLTGLHEDVEARGGTLRSKVLQQELIPASAAVAAELGLAEGSPATALPAMVVTED